MWLLYLNTNNRRHKRCKQRACLCGQLYDASAEPLPGIPRSCYRCKSLAGHMPSAGCRSSLQGIAKLIGIKILFTAAVSVTEIVINYLSRRCPLHPHIMTHQFCPETSEQFFFSCAITQSYCQLYLHPITLACCQKAEPEITARFFQ